MLRDPVCNQRMQRNHAYAKATHDRVTYYLCCPRCQAEFEANPARYARPELGEQGVRAARGARSRGETIQK